ncbi:unnamed protein product [Dicrocoelium dendriticum]|nr:unnamed protein product [Dicrocoelium dendriticum]
MSCGGSYLKLLNSKVDPNQFYGDSPYLFMFGPDICGYSTKKVHAIFNYKGRNHLIKKEVRCKDDLLSHLYTFILTPDNKYSILIDNEKVEEGSLEDDWDMLPPRKIDDPNAKKPEDWVDTEQIDDPEDKKPEDWDQPEQIPDTSATQPEDWDTELDGEWSPPMIANPDYKGEWKPRKIDNPLYKGPWIAPQIDNPSFQPDDKLYVMEDISQLGLDLWQVSSGSIFDDFLLTNDPEFARSEGERLWRPRFNVDSEYEKHKESEDLKEAEDKSDDTDDEDKLESTEDLEKPDSSGADKADEHIAEPPEDVNKVESDTHEEL